ncbi:CPBP family intramembrane glutamic endopeptidase [Mariniblastus fucicola]|nr:CPBP family intramembrane glutamic endopeptidase [Mariniblastus fucicola]
MLTAFAIVQYSILAICLALWSIRISAYRPLFGTQRREEFMLPRMQQVSPVGMVDIFVTVLLWFCLQSVGLILVPLLMGISFEQLQDPESLSPRQLLEFSGWMALLQLLSTFAAAAYLLIRHRRVGWLGSGKWLGNDVLLGIVSSLMLIPVVMLIQLVVTQLIPYTHPTLDSLTENFTGATAIWAWIAAVGVAPLAEEFFFRGLIQGWLQRAFDYDEPKAWFSGGVVEESTAREFANGYFKQLQFWAPILITSIAFAGVHMGQGPAPIPLFFLSIGIGYVFRKSGSLWPCVIVHMLLNSLSLTMLTLGVMYPELMPADVEPAPALVW